MSRKVMEKELIATLRDVVKAWDDLPGGTKSKKCNKKDKK